MKGLGDSEARKALPQLRSVSLNDMPITDAGLRALHGMTQLQSVNVYGTRVTEAGAAELRKAIPKCNVYTGK